MSSVLPLLFKVDSQVFSKTTVWNFTPRTVVWWLYTTLSFKRNLQIRAILLSTKSEQLHKGVSIPATASTNICKYGCCKKYKFHDSSL